MSIRDYKQLNIWQKGIVLVEAVYKTTNKFPKNEEYGLVVQMRRSAVSVPSNIAEGFARQHNKEYKQFLFVALGSLSELETQFIISKNLKYIDDKSASEIIDVISILSRMIMSLVKKIN